MRQTLPINAITIPVRLRKSVPQSHIDSLSESIRTLGLLCPVGLASDKTLVYGFCRLTACKQLGWTEIDYVDTREAPEDERLEMEFAENKEREDFAWQDEAMGYLRIYRMKKLKGVQQGWKWGHTQACAMFKMSLGQLDYILLVAKRLEDEEKLPAEQRRLWNFSSINEAYRLGILAEEEDRLNQELAKRAKQSTATAAQAVLDQKVVQHVQAVSANPDALADEREKYESNPLNTQPFDEYWAEKVADAEIRKNTIYLSNNFFHINCIDFMNNTETRFDAIITDPPYAIDMNMLNQQNQHGGLVDLDRVEDAHQVDENMKLLAAFFPAAYRCTTDKATLAICCDPMLFVTLYTHATEAGFAVQRWPFIWRKINQSVMNNSPQYNTTKDFEFVMLCRKPAAVLAEKTNSSFLDASNTEVTKLFGHPFSKPFELTKKLVQICTLPRSLILEPFAGGGSMVVETLRQDRRVIACEREEHWYNSLLTNVKTQFYLKLNPKAVFK